jgi:hypothetical protein
LENASHRKIGESTKAPMHLLNIQGGSERITPDSYMTSGSCTDRRPLDRNPAWRGHVAGLGAQYLVILETETMKRIGVIRLAFTWLLAVNNLCSQVPVQSSVPSPTVLTGSAASGQLEELRRDAEALESAGCNGQYIYLDHPTTVGDFIGGKATGIRVVRFAQQFNSRNQRELPEVLREVWDGRFQSASCQISWAEVTLWSIAAVVEFDDGKHSNSSPTAAISPFKITQEGIGSFACFHLLSRQTAEVR